MYKGIGLTPSFNLSHMFYADDAVFMGQWSEKNINTIIYVLKCFQQASGLHINLSKSKLMGLAVGDESVSQAADQIGCGVLKAPFTYLGSIVGANMSQIQSWDAIVGKMEARLSKWKMKTLSIGGRLTLLQEMESLKKKDIDLFSYMQKKLGNGVDTSFWNDAWRGEMKLKHKFSRIRRCLTKLDGLKRFLSRLMFLLGR
ncbi:hypothetical protein Tco_1282741 [Tanacetum coccineum]